MSAPETEAGTSRQKLFIVALFAVFMFPIVGALVLNVSAPSWLPFGQVNRGELVKPPLRMAPALLERTGRRAISAEDGTATWMVVHVSAPPCATICQQALVSLRQARLALGKDASRVDRWWLMTEEADARTVEWVGATHPGLRLMQLGEAWPIGPETAPLQIVDPAGYVIMTYESPDAASDLLKDLKRLLKISKQG